MFQIAIVVVSIVLVATLASATLFYGGASYSGSRERTIAHTIVAQSTQIKAAFLLYKLEKGKSATSVQELVDAGYIKPLSFPFEGAGSYGTVQGLWVIQDWNMTGTGEPVYVLSIRGVNGRDGEFARICNLALREIGVTPNAAAHAVDEGIVCKDEGGGTIFFEMHLGGSF